MSLQPLLLRRQAGVLAQLSQLLLALADDGLELCDLVGGEVEFASHFLHPLAWGGESAAGRRAVWADRCRRHGPAVEGLTWRLQQ